MLLTYSTAVLCAVFIIITGAVSGEEVKKAVGGTVSFRPDKLVSPPVTSFTWKQINSGTIKAIEWDDDDGVSIPNPRFKDITTLDNKTGQITITNLQIEHSGLYTIDINSKEQGQRFTLTVMERVPKPVITIEKSKNHDVAYLKCEYKETIIWKNSAGDTLEGTKNHNPGEFKVENTRNTANFYTCTLKNDVSEETSDRVYEGEIFGTDSGHWWIALIVLVILILLAASSFILLYKFYDPFDVWVSDKCKDKPCLGAILNCLDGKEKALLTSPSDAENGEKTEIALLTSPSPAENGGNTEIALLTSPSDAENGEKTEIAPLTSPSPAENGEEPLKADRDGEKGEGSREKTEIADGDKQEGSENSNELHRASESGQ